MCKEAKIPEEVMKFNRYLVFYTSDEGRSGIKGIRSDAPQDVKDAFIEWYRDNNRYPSGRLRPRTASLERELIVDVDTL